MTAAAPPSSLDRTDGAAAPRLRANPLYELVPLERLSEAERRVLDGGGEALYGLLRPADGSGLAPRSASTDLALLVLTLREPGPLPEFAARSLGGDASETTARLVLDGVLEVERDGRFVSGPAALEAAVDAPRGPGRVGELSLAALRHGQALEGLPEELLALRLYGFGRRPLTRALARGLPDEDAVARFLGPPAEGWLESGTSRGEPWRMLRRGGAPHARASFKLYVAPALDALPEAFAALSESLDASAGFKVARDAAGLCRPDKLVAYFHRLEDLRAAAARLAPRLAGLPAQPVPFTGGIDAEGILSWGVDPQAGRDGARSWRLWLVSRLASSLVEARERAGGVEPWRFALERIRLDGIDVESWAPRSTAWDGSR